VVGRNRVVITGIGVLAANGIGKDAFWNSLLAGESGIGPITQFDADGLACKIAGEINDFDPLNFIEARLKPQRMARFSQLAISATMLALEDANISVETLRSFSPLPMIIGVSTSDFSTILERPRAYSTSSLIPHAPASSVAAMLGLNCELTTLSNACTSGLDAIAYGSNLINNNKADIVIVGGSDSSITRKSLEFLCRGNMLPTEMNDLPNIASRPFDLQRSGGVLAEGAGILVLESERRAIDRSATVYAEILGFGSRADFTSTRNELSLSASMSSAICNANIYNHQIEYINAHAPSDPYVDHMETLAIKITYDKHAYEIPIGSIKGAIGNPLGAGGILQCISTALSIDQECLPPTTNYATPDPDCDLDYIADSPRKQRVECAMVNSRGISGNTSSMVLKAYT
jgi:3-oxoacyl-[acyl-carrier-protein] synthase II